MKKYFICSDIHGFFDEWMLALKRKKFDSNNPDHILVILGDIFDRGKQPLEIYTFLIALPKERRILIRGNHEYLLKELVKRGYPEMHDKHNHTLDTLYQLQRYESEEEFIHDMYREIHLATAEDESSIRAKYERNKDNIYKGTVLDIIKWIDSDEWVNYWETNNYIFVHGWIPLLQHIDWEKSRIYGYYIKSQDDEYREDWRNATDTEWEDATWFNWRSSANLIKAGLNKTGKYIVVGHWHTSDLYKFLNGTYKLTYDCPIYKSKRYKVIGLDACTAGSKKVNVLVLNENEL